VLFPVHVHTLSSHEAAPLLVESVRSIESTHPSSPMANLDMPTQLTHTHHPTPNTHARPRTCRQSMARSEFEHLHDLNVRLVDSSQTEQDESSSAPERPHRRGASSMTTPASPATTTSPTTTFGSTTYNVTYGAIGRDHSDDTSGGGSGGGGGGGGTGSGGGRSREEPGMSSPLLSPQRGETPSSRTVDDDGNTIDAGGPESPHGENASALEQRVADELKMRMEVSVCEGWKLCCSARMQPACNICFISELLINRITPTRTAIPCTQTTARLCCFTLRFYASFGYSAVHMSPKCMRSLTRLHESMNRTAHTSLRRMCSLTQHNTGV
jgi:hypothetical protein